MQTIRLKAHVGTDGLLKLEIPLEVADSDLEVEVTISSVDQPAAIVMAWPPGYFEQTFGALADDPLLRAPQGEYEQREPMP